MTVIPADIWRASDTLRWSLLSRTVSQRSLDLLRLQRQLSSGLRLTAPSEDPIAGRLALALKRSLQDNEQYLSNVQRGSAFLQATESALADVVEFVREAESLGEQEVSLPSNGETRMAAADVVGSIIDLVLSVANRRSAGRFLFSGLKDDAAPFELLGPAIRYNGSDGRATTSAGEGQFRDISISGAEAFRAWTGVVDSPADLDAVIAPETLLTSLNGGLGAETQTIIVSDGTTTTTIDLSPARDIADVIQMMEAALPATTSVTVDAAAGALRVTSTLPGANIEISDVPGGATARHLGLETPSGGCGSATFVGTDLDPVITPLTSLDDLGGSATLDRTSGFIITNGLYTATVDISACGTFEDLINEINTCGCCVEARIAPEGDGLQIISLLSGAPLTIGENGGSTATDLGIRSLDGGTSLSGLKRGRGVSIEAGAPDLHITFSDGTTADVDLTGAMQVQDVLDAIEAAAPGRIRAGLVAVGNGLQLEDLTGGAGAFTVNNAGRGGTAASDLGLLMSVDAPATVITGDDVNPIVAENTMTHLLELRGALQADDTDAIRAAATRLMGDMSDLSGVRAKVGGRLNGLISDKTWLEDQRLADQELLALTRDLDYSVAVAEFTAVSTLVEAALRTAASISQLSLLDYL